MKHDKYIVPILLSLLLSLSGCNLLTNPETEEEREAPRLLDTKDNRKKTWYCYGQSTDEWKCTNSPDPSLVRSIEPEAPRQPPPTIGGPTVPPGT